MPTVLGLGDNTIDIYVDRGIQYPGGNSLNFAVYAKKLGAYSHYMGCIGDDAFGDHIERALKSEGVLCPRLRRTAIKTSWSRVRHSNGDRWFDGSHLYTAEEYDLSICDDAYIDQFDLVHIGVNSMLDDKIEDIFGTCRRLSYDFSDKFTEISLSRIAPYVEVAVLSQAEGTLDQAKALAAKVAEFGVKEVLVTRGSEGALCLSKGSFHTQEIVPTNVVDTLGAGDAFTATYIVKYLQGVSVLEALKAAAEFASEVCRLEAAFGYGEPASIIPEANRPKTGDEI